MRKNKLFLALLLTTLLMPVNMIKAKEKKGKEAAIPSCTKTGDIQCPKGFKPSCPEQYKPLCIFVGTRHLPSCLADNPDNTVLTYNLDKITCKKGK